MSRRLPAVVALALTLAVTSVVALPGPATATPPGAAATTTAAQTTTTRTTTASAAVLPADAGLSTPREDSYYPAKGDPTVDALHYGLDLTWLRATRRLVGRTTMLMRATRDDSVIRLDLSSRLIVGRVLVDGRAASYTHRGHHLVIARPVTAQRRYRVRVTYRGTPGTAAGPASRPDIARLGMRVTRDGQLWTMQEPFGAFTWYPVNDHPSDKAMYDVRVSAPGRWVGVSNGRLVSRRTTPTRTITRWTNRDPMASYLLTLAVGPYDRYRQTGPHGLPLTYWYPRGQRHLLAPLKQTPAAVRWLERRLGPYPFDRFGIVVTPGAPSAMETQTLVTFTRSLFGYGPLEVRSIVVHELAHQWYGDTVTPDDWRDVWMNEGMATYLEARWRDQHSGELYDAWTSSVTDWRLYDGWNRREYGPPGAYKPQHFGADNVYFSVALMWERLRRRVGDATFNRLTRAWPQRRRNTNADRDDLIAFWERGSGQELSGFFHRWLNSPTSPA